MVVGLALIAGFIALPQNWSFSFSAFNRDFSGTLATQTMRLPGINVGVPSFSLKQGLDIRGGMQVVLQADMSEIAEDDRQTALTSASEVLARRVDLYGISEPEIRTTVTGDSYRILVDLAGVTDEQQALELIGTTAELQFRLQNLEAIDDIETATFETVFNAFEPTGLGGKQLQRAEVAFDQNTGQPVISLQFNPEGTKLFADITAENQGEVLGIFLDDVPLMLPQIQASIPTGQAQITGQFTLDEAKQLVIQLNAGALPVPISIIEQRTVGPSLGQASIKSSLNAGLVGIGLVAIFMIALYGWRGFIADIALLLYGLYTLALYKLLGVTLSVPGIAGLLLSIGMAVDANILIFERMKEELRLGKSFQKAMRLGFGRAWDSIKDANLATIFTALVLINPLDFPFLNTSGIVRGFGITLLLGVVVSLFTGVFVTRTLMKLFLKESN